MTERYDFFISYIADDKAWAEWIAWQLEDAGYATVLFPRDFKAGDTYMKKISRALLDCDRLILVMSSAFLASPWVQADLHYFRGLGSDSPEGRVIPVRVEACEPSPPLNAIQWLDLVGLDAYTACKVLLDGVGPKRARPTTVPAFPGIGNRLEFSLMVVFVMLTC